MRAGGGRSRRSRRLSDEERTLWKTVTRSIAPLRPGEAPAVGEAAEAPAPVKPPPARKPAAASVPPARQPKGPPPLAPLEKRLRQRLVRGSETIDRRIDLHGLTQSDAHRALTRFLRSAQSAGAKVVLVVTGKGARAADHDPLAERGVLRRLVPQWLAQPDYRDIVLGFEAAHAAHGGTGALYVRLRNQRQER